MIHRPKQFVIATCALVCLAACTPVRAELGFFGRVRQWPGTPCNCPTSPACPDDYCRKPLPAVPCPTGSCTPPCFTRKPLPCPPRCIGTVTCDDYMPKCLPQEPCPFRPCAADLDACLRAPWYKPTSRNYGRW